MPSLNGLGVLGFLVESTVTPAGCNPPGPVHRESWRKQRCVPRLSQLISSRRG
jgi:hypothetical protein